jgi:hypothetical protein
VADVLQVKPLTMTTEARRVGADMTKQSHIGTLIINHGNVYAHYLHLCLHLYTCAGWQSCGLRAGARGGACCSWVRVTPGHACMCARHVEVMRREWCVTARRHALANTDALVTAVRL